MGKSRTVDVPVIEGVSGAMKIITGGEPWLKIPTIKPKNPRRNAPRMPEKRPIGAFRELSTTLVLLFSAVALFIIGRDIGLAIFVLWSGYCSTAMKRMILPMFQAWGFALSEIAIPVLSYLIIVAIAGVYGSIALGGYNWSWETASFKPSKLNPLNGFKRMFGPNGLVELLKAIAKFLTVGTITYFALSFSQQEALHLIRNCIH